MSARWEAATPHRCPCTTYFFFVFFAFFFAIRAVTSFRATMIGQNEGALPSAPSSSSSRPSSSSGLVTSFRLQRSVAHRLAPKVLGLFPAPALVVHEIGVQLRERHDLEAPLLEQTREYPLVVGREQVDRAVALRRAEPEARRDRRRVALEVAVDRRHPDLGRHQRGAGVHREGVPAAVSLREPDDLGDQPPRDPLGGEVRRELVLAVGVALAPRLEQVGGLGEPDPLALVSLDPGEVLEPLDPVVAVAEAHRRRPRQLLEPPTSLPLGQQYPCHPSRARSEERLERPSRRTEVALDFLFDEDVLEGEVAVAREVEIAEVAATQDRRALRADIGRGGHGVGRRQLAPNLSELRDRLSDLARLTEGTDF